MNKNLKQPKTVGGRHCRPNNLVMSFLRTMLFLAVMVIGTGSAWGDVSLGKVTIGSTITQNTSTEQNFGNNGVIAAGLISGTLEITNPAGYYAKINQDGKIKIRVNKGSVVPSDILKVNVGPSGDNSENLGYIVEGSYTFVEAGQKTAPDKYTMGQDIAYTLKASDIQNEDASYDFIQINRSDGGHAYAYHSVEIVRPDGNVIKWTSGDIPTGCDAWYTLGDDPTHRKESISGITTGTKVTLTATDAGNAHKIIDYWTFGKSSLYNNAANREMIDWNHAVDGVLNLQPHFCDAYTMTAVAGTGCSSVSLKGTKDANTTEINGIKQKSSATYSLTFTATSESGADFDGWYNGDTKISGENPYNYGEYSAGGTTDLSLTAKFKVRVTEAFNPVLDLNSTVHGGKATMTEGVLTATGSTDNWVQVKDMTGHGNEYSGIRITTNGKPSRIIVRWGEADATQHVTKVDGSTKATTSYYSWSMLGVPQGKFGDITSIRFAGSDYDYGATTFTNCELVNVTETTPYTREVGALREFNLKDTRVNVYDTGKRYQMGGNIEWVYKEETSGNKFVTMKTTGTSWNQMEIFNSGHGIPTYDGIHIDFKGQHFRVIAYKGDERHDYTVPASTDKITARFVTWADLGITDPAGLTRVDVAGCSEHLSEESVNFYGIRLYKSLRDIIYTDESVNKGDYNGNLAYRESHDGKDMSVVFKNITGDDRANDCQGTIVNKGTEHGFTIEAPGCYNIKKVFVGLGENSTSTVLFNNNNVDVNNQNQIEWTNTATSSTVTMTIPNNAANVLHVKYVYYELEEIKIPSIEVNGQTRQYIVYAPDGITSSESSKVGVIFSLHGASNDYWNGRVDFNAIAEAKKNVDGKKFIVVYPRGLMRQLRGQERGWETYTESNTEDVEFFKAIVTELKKTYSVDMSRIYLAGFSNGGMMAYKAAHQAGDFFAAFASVGGFPVNESHLFHAGSQPTPFIHIQGKADQIFSESTYPSSVIVHNMIYRNGSNFTSLGAGDGIVGSNDKVESDCHAAATGGAAYYYYKVKDLGHWYTADWTGDGKDDIAPAIWAFFNKSDKVINVDKTLKFRIDDPNNFWEMAKNGTVGNVNVGYIGFDKVDDGTSVLSYGGRTKTDNGTATFDKDSNNKNLWHSLQFNGGINGAAHFLKLNVYTKDVGGASNENKSNFFLVKLTRIDPDNNKDKEVVIFSKRYQAGRGQKDLYINFAALPGFNEYKLEITKSNELLAVQINGMEVHTGKCQDVAQTENPTAFEDVATVLAGMNPIYQPVFENSYRGIAKEYLPIADIPVGSHSYTYHDNTITYKTVEDNLKTNSDTPLESLPSTMIASTGWTTNDGVTTATITNKTFFSLAKSGKTDEKTSHKSKNAVVLSDGTYTVDRTKGINISQLGRAEMPEYLNGTRLTFPTHGVIAIKVQGTVDFTLLAQNDITYPGDYANKGRSTLKVYYTNDQMAGELKELKEWWFYGVRTEVNVDDKKAYTDHPNGNNMNPLSVNVRLPQLGMDGTCTLFITYEGRRNDDYTFTHPDGTDPKVYDGVDDSDKIWIKGFVIKRPDLKVTIGRTDSKYAGQNRGDEENTKLTRFGENKPYIWSFENVGFNNTKNENLNDKKVNVEDSRTYVCGGTDDSMDHLLLYSDITKIIDPGTGELILDNKVQFDGSLAGQEHIEFRKPSQYLMKDNPADASNGRLEFNPITSNGLKVNVTGSGWFKIKCSAPNGKVKMKVFSSTNYGITYTNLLREFIVDNSKHPASATGEEEHRWGEYTVYLKGHVELKKTEGTQEGFWDGDVIRYDEDKVKDAEEKVRMSLYVVFDKLNDETYTEDHKGAVSATPQLNIHQLSWLNEEPADYVFQREEDPKLLTEWQAIRRDGDGNKTLDDSTDANVVLYWKAGNDDDANYPVLKGHANGSYNVINQVNTDDAAKGVKSPGGYASTSVPSDAGTYDAYWDIAAPARVNALVEKAYGDNAKKTDTQYAYSSGNNTEFDTPVSGSFIRISAMKNTYVVAHVIPGKTSVSSNATPHSGATVYVLDETGNPIPSSSSDPNASRLGYIATMVNGGSAQNGGVASQDKTIRIDFVANAGKEYFICAKDASISLARLEVHDWRHKPTKAETLALVDGASGTTNSTAIATAYDAGNYYMDATLTRTFATGKWASLVLPFSLNEQKFKEVFGENAKCIHFTDVDTENNIVKLTHHYYNMIVAGRPVFIYTPEQVVNPQFNDITLQTKDVKNTTTTSGFTFHASYDGTQMKWNDLYMNNANAIKYVSNDKSKQLTYPGMRSFIQSPNNYDPSDVRAGSAGAKAVFLSFLDDDYQDIPTGIEELISAELGEDVVVVTKTTKIYDLLGNVMGEGSDINSLPAGIYIVNGKKYIVK